MSNDKQLSLLPDESPVESWRAGKTKDVVRFVLEAEAYLQGREVSGPQRQTLISAVTMIKQGKWTLSCHLAPRDVAEKLDEYLESGMIYPTKDR